MFTLKNTRNAGRDSYAQFLADHETDIIALIDAVITACFIYAAIRFGGAL